ncbi:winged helix-turn-helix transcriptional regulator [Halobium salinum]|uniref:Winged helix-turn-helix transcriptional regulator n=1 Tax=Halobium salinum TaxID=1364940 RepID=A0ABD5P7Q6_9EURY|nr:helix-turn-helix domain-containing protein [Halobium salinum]
MSEVRGRIEEHVRRNPGVHFNELVRALDLAPGQVQHHLYRLLDGPSASTASVGSHGEGASLLAEERYGRTHYYPPTFDEWERGALALVRRETSRDVLRYLLEHGPSAPAAVAEELGIARSTLEWHLGHLVECDVVEKERDDRGRVTLVLARPEATLDLLAAVSPSLPERFVDRFTRLVDGLLEPPADEE